MGHCMKLHLYITSGTCTMDHDRMLAVLASLADGIDPASGTAFPADSPYQHPETVRALFLAIRRLDAAESASTFPAAGSASTFPAAGSASTLPAAGSAQITNAAAPSTPTDASPIARKPSANSSTPSKAGNAGKAWTAEEDQRLAAAFDAGEDIGGLTKAHGRSRLALEIRLAKLGRLPMPEKTLYGNKPQPNELSQTVPSADVRPGDVRPAKAKSASASRRASESGGLRYHVTTSIAPAGLRI